MKKFLYSLLALFSVAIMTVAGGVQYAHSQTLSPGGGTGVLQPGLFYLKNGAILTTNPAYTIGSPTQPIAAGYFTFLSAATASISGVGTGNLLPATDNTFNIGSATRTWANLYIGTGGIHASGTSDFVGITWRNATGTNTTSTNLFATNFQFTNATGTYVTSTQFTANGSGSATEPLFKMIGGGVAYGLYMNGSNQAAFTANGLPLWYASQNEFTVSNGTIRALNDNATSLGLLNTRYSNMFSVNASSTNTSSTNSSVSNLTFTSATATTGGTLSVQCNTTNAPGIRGVGAGQDTGICINNADQIIFILNGNTTVTFDPSNGVQFSRAQPVSPGSGDIGVVSSRWGGGYINNVTSTKLYLENELAINGTSTANAFSSYKIDAANFNFLFPAGATSVIVNDAFVRSTTSTVVQATIGAFDNTMERIQYSIPAVGQVRFRAPATPTANTLVSVTIFNQR